MSAYYLAGALGGYLPGLAYERWEWPGVAGLVLSAYAVGIVAVIRRAGRVGTAVR